MTKAIRFRDLETGKVVRLKIPFSTLMEKLDILGEIEYEGRRYKRLPPKTRRRATNRVGNLAYNRDLVSIGAGCHSSQAGEFNESARKAGISGVYYDPKTGKAHFSSRKARRLELARRGIHDRDGGYGDG